jgi:diguanylate cyclase (GGDEF)-like protein/PAS domain S-box-containing protein
MKGFLEAATSHGAWEYEHLSERIGWSERLYRIHGLDPDEFVPDVQSVLELIHPDDREEFVGVVAKAIGSRSSFAIQLRVTRPDGTVRTVIVRGDQLAGGRLVGTAQDVTSRPGYEERLWHLANEDSLTGLFNRRRFLEELDREVAVARRTGTPGAVLMFDLDQFKGVNDTLGHAVGDTLLKRVATALRSRLRATDTLGRLGGDEFAAVLPNCGISEARKIAGEIVAAIAATGTLRFTTTAQHVTASAGLAEYGRDAEESGDAALVAADLAMYTAKAAGGDRVEVFAPEMRADRESAIAGGDQSGPGSLAA